MDVDLLRPGTVPISPDTVLWFEFLLEEDLLLKHLEKPYPDPSSLDLINKFTSVVLESSKKPIDVENGDAEDDVFEEPPKYILKHIALKILSLKIFAYLKWDLEKLKELPLKYQMTLLQDLIYFTNNETIVEIPKIPDEENINELSLPYFFALVLYHRWFIRTAVNYVFTGPLKSIGNMDVVSFEKIRVQGTENTQKSICFLTKVLESERIPNLLTFDCFIALREDKEEIKNDWNRSVPICKEEFYAQISYDLAVFYFFKENYEAANSYFSKCMQYYNADIKKTGFLNINYQELSGYLLALANTVEGTDNLLQQLHFSILNQYMGILNILQQDNIYKIIPMMYRITVELDIKAAISSGTFTVARDLLPKVQALNAVRCILEKTYTYHYEFNSSNIDTLTWAIEPHVKVLNLEEKKRLQSFLTELILTDRTPELFNTLLTNNATSDLLKDVAGKIKKFLFKRVEIPRVLRGPLNEIIDTGFGYNTRLEVKSMEQLIISCYDPTQLRMLLIKTSSKSLSRSVWKINPCWELPIPLQSVLVSMPKGFLQDYSFVLLAKSRELMLSKNWKLSLEFLKILTAEIQQGNGNYIAKLSRLISWEALLIKINQLLEEWPAPNLDRKELAQECQACLQTAESVLPRTEIMEHCALCLLSLGHWDMLSVLEKRWNYFEIASTIALACQDLIKYKESKKLSRDLWDLVLPVFSSSPLQMKRSSTGSTTIINRDSPITSTKSMLVSFFLRLRDSTVLTVVISMLARLHNVLRDESSLEIDVEYITLWPAVVSNSNSYNSKAVLEVLIEIIQKALHYYPINASWIRLMGDINFVNGHHEESLNYYLKFLLLSSDNFNAAIRNDNHIIRRMIKCSSALNCHTQAAVLCQFLDEPDYTSAFHILAEQKLCADSSDAYYHCFWDTSILEYLVNLHHKKGEFRRRKHAIQVMGTLELNSNNNEEIQHEAITLRKNLFLRALSKQYVH